jgi:hypothetical protein
MKGKKGGKMKKEVLFLNALAVMARLEQGKSVEGGLSIDQETGCITFRPYNRLSREPGYVPPSVTLYETSNGSLRQTAQRNKIVVSVKRKLGNIRGAIEIMAQARELTDYLKGLAKTE